MQCVNGGHFCPPQEVEQLRQEKLEIDQKLRSIHISGSGMMGAGGSGMGHPYYNQRRGDRLVSA